MADHKLAGEVLQLSFPCTRGGVIALPQHVAQPTQELQWLNLVVNGALLEGCTAGRSQQPTGVLLALAAG